MGTPCCSWSQARRGPPNSSWCRLRSPSHLWSLPNLSQRARLACEKGNSQLKLCLSLIRACRSNHVPAALENP
eukprot:9489452-Pyramimonas_sp.AAC.1